MDWKNLFLSFEGRINRQPYWLGTIALLVGAFVVYFILQIFMGGSMFGDPTKMLEPGFMEGYMKTVSWRQLIMLAIIGYPATALMVKRLNDRDRPSWYVGLFWLPSVLSIVLGILGLSYTFADTGNGMQLPTPTSLGMILSVLTLVIGLWSLIELGILRGTDGPNRFGDDPLG
jgi:uncharacterized membrane protein YhaH (DUF805 family)